MLILSRPQSSLPDQQHKHDHDHDRNKHQHQHHDKKDHDKKDRPRYYDRRLEDLKATKATESSDYSYGKDVYGHGHDDHDLAPVVLRTAKVREKWFGWDWSMSVEC
ncbi:hypothetical protein GN244_ATG14042 [Phytophthora infestans]|uniref:Uncharacterized protein n=1 Tax=Phytophthora infestans TaxID=4787 RepID=A0A833W9K6_PHYIN|nr:hypothetical protein GN244_ATG14042 [Phytophthora infestans]